MVELLLRPLADAFLEVGVFVALMLAPYAWARQRWGDRMDAALERHAHLGPAVGALLTGPPGCGGAIMVMAVYSRGACSFGTAVAALVATMGDASWVLLAADPVLTLQLKAVLIVTGAVTGYIVDALGISPALRTQMVRAAPALVVAGGSRTVAEVGAGRGARPVELVLPILAPPTRRRRALDRAAASTAPVFWLLVAVGVLLGLPVAFQLVDPAVVAGATGGVDVFLLLGVAGTAVCAVSFVRGGCRLADDHPASPAPTTLLGRLQGSATEISFVTTWVALAYLGWSLFTTATGFDGSTLPVFGMVGVLVGAAVGLIPGCAIQIVFTGIFVAGGMPLPTLVASTISQDGDALLPLLALQKRSALVATLITTIPAVVVGTVFLAFG